MEDFLSFKKMVTPIIIQVLFWVALLLVVIGAIGNIANGQALQGLLLLILGPVAVRMYCELIILAFRMYDRLCEIAGNTGKGSAAPVTGI